MLGNLSSYLHDLKLYLSLKLPWKVEDATFPHISIHTCIILMHLYDVYVRIHIYIFNLIPIHFVSFLV